MGVLELGGSGAMEKDISLANRRIFSRYVANMQFTLKRKGILGSAFTVLINDISSKGLQIISETKPKPGDKAVLTLTEDDRGIAITCAWAKPKSHDGKFISGWALGKPNGAVELFTKFIETQSLSKLEDRRLSKAESPTSKRIADLANTEAFLTPDNYPVYRRSSAGERRVAGRRRQGETVQMERRSSADRRGSARRSGGPTPDIKENTIENNLKIMVSTMRDILIPYMPDAMVRMLVGKGNFVFIAHARDLKDVVRVYPFAKWFPESWLKAWWMRKKPFLASRITGLKDNQGNPVYGWFLVAPRWTVQMMKDNDMARRCIEDAVVLAEKVGAKVAGLGAFTSIVTHDGKDLLGKTKIGLTTGNPLSAAVAVQNMLRAAELVDLDLSQATVAIIGAAGSVGSGCARVSADKVHRLILVDINKRALEQLVNDMPPSQAIIDPQYDLTHVPEADVVIVATNSPGIVIRSQHLKDGCIAIDCAQPKNVSEEVPHLRKDVLVIESAVVETPSVDCHFDFDLNRHEALGCLAETMVLTTMNWPNHYAIGKAQKHQVQEVYAAARKAGFRLAYFRNSSGYIKEDVIENVKRVLSKRSSAHV
jgi:fatty aldehyde-generating acyl-ACP reductase